MSQPISLAILVHSAVLYPRTSDDKYGNPAFGTAVNLSRIRISTVKQTIASSLGEAKNDRLALNFDCVNSLPAGTTFKERDKIVYGGESYLVREVSTPSGDSAGIHHYRLALVGS